MVDPRTSGLLALSVLVLFVTLVALDSAPAQSVPGACVEGLGIMANHDTNLVALAWDPTPGAQFYDVHLVVEGGDSEHIATVPGTETFFRHIAPDGILDYRVAADGHPSLDCPAVSVHLGGVVIPPDMPVCVGGLSAVARNDGSIQLSWPAIPGALSYDVLRAEGEMAPLTPFALIGAPSGNPQLFVDETTEPGVTYRYSVAANGLPRDTVCEVIRVTAVPFFGLLGGALAAGGAMVAYAAMRRAA